MFYVRHYTNSASTRIVDVKVSCGIVTTTQYRPAMASAPLPTRINETSRNLADLDQDAEPSDCHCHSAQRKWSKSLRTIPFVIGHCSLARPCCSVQRHERYDSAMVPGTRRIRKWKISQVNAQPCILMEKCMCKAGGCAVCQALAGLTSSVREFRHQEGAAFMMERANAKKKHAEAKKQIIASKKGSHHSQDRTRRRRDCRKLDES
jgi:hypothetical protein